jgi:hypothetical protein
MESRAVGTTGSADLIPNIEALGLINLRLRRLDGTGEPLRGVWINRDDEWLGLGGEVIVYLPSGPARIAVRAVNRNPVRGGPGMIGVVPDVDGDELPDRG